MTQYLQIGFVLKLNHRSGEYTIKEVIGRGASTIAYLTDYTVCSEYVSERIIKEYYPCNCKIERREDGSLLCDEKDKQKYEQGKQLFQDGAKRQNELRHKTNLKNETPPLQGIYEANETLYLEETPFEGKTYDRFEKLSLLQRMKICLAVAKLVRQYHRLGYLCLDLKPTNIFILTNSANEIVTDLIELIDFDSIRSQKEIAFGASLSFTEAWAAPEQTNPYGYHKISEKTDIYTVGELVFWSLFNRHSSDEEHRGFSKYPYEASNCPFAKEVNRLEVKNLFTELFHNTIRSSYRNRYASMNNVVVILEKIVVELSKKEYIIANVPNSSPVFIGREEEIKKIDELLMVYKTVFLCGIGGIGKSTLVRNYCANKASKYDCILYLQYTKSLQATFIDEDQLRIHAVSKKTEESDGEYFKRKLQHLEDLVSGKEVLFVLDNFDGVITKELSYLLHQQWNVIIVSRRTPANNSYEVLPVDEISKEQCFHLFALNLGRDILEEERENVFAMIENVARHTLAIELLAKQIASSHLSIETATYLTQKHGFSNIAQEKINYIKDETEYNDTMASIITAVFDASHLSISKKIILKVLSLCSISGLNMEMMQTLLELETKDDFNELARDGWLYIENMRVKLHPVVSETINLWEWEDVYCKAIFSIMKQIFFKIKIENKKEEYPRNLLLLNQKINQTVKEYPSLEIIITSMMKEKGYIGECFYERFMSEDAMSPTNHEQLQKWLDVSEVLLEGSKKVNQIYSSRLYKDLLSCTVMAMPCYREQYIIEKVKELLFNKDHQNSDIVLKLYDKLISIYLQRKDLIKAYEEIINAKQFLVKHSTHYAKAIFYDILANYYDEKLDGAYDGQTKEQRESRHLLLDSLNKAIYHAKRTRYLDGKSMLATCWLSKANILIRSNPEKKKEIDTILNFVKKLAENETLPYSEIRCDYNMSRAWYYTLVKPNLKGVMEFVKEAYEIAKYTCQTELDQIDKIIIPIANMFLEWEKYEMAVDWLDIGIRVCNEYSDIVPYVRKKIDLLHYIKEVYEIIEEEEKIREIEKVIEAIGKV